MIIEFIILFAAICIFVTAVMAVLTQNRWGVFIGLAYCMIMLAGAAYIWETIVV